MDTLKRPYTTAELFDCLLLQLNKDNKVPDLLDYAITSKYDIQELRYYEFSVGYHLQYGGSEGIYLDVYIEGDWGQQGRTEHYYSIGTCKTLRTDDDAMIEMAKLGAWFVITGDKVVREQVDDLTWKGYSAKLTKNRDGKSLWLECSSMELIVQNLSKYGDMDSLYDVVVRNNETRQVWDKTGVMELMNNYSGSKEG